MPHPLDGGRWDRPHPRLESPDALPCENDQAKPDRLSRLARSTLLSKILTTLRLSGAVWIEARAVTPGCPRTYCACWVLLDYVRQHFCANFLKVSNFTLHVKVNQTLLSRFPPQPIHGAQYQRTTSTNAQATRAYERNFLPGHAMGLFSAGFPTGAQLVRLALLQLTLRTSFPLPSSGRP